MPQETPNPFETPELDWTPPELKIEGTGAHAPSVDELQEGKSQAQSKRFIVENEAHDIAEKAKTKRPDDPDAPIKARDISDHVPDPRHYEEDKKNPWYKQKLN